MMTTHTTPAASVHVSISGRTDIGLRRPKNEDSFLIEDLGTRERRHAGSGIERMQLGKKGILLVVSDGMGGEKAGEVASALVVEGFARALESAPVGTPPAAQLKHAAAAAHLAVAAEARAHDRRGMGATLTAVFLTGRSAYVAEVGDSRAYLLRAGHLRQLTRDQSVAQALMDAGAIAPGEAKVSPMKDVLLQAMGHDSAVQVALGKLALRDRDCLLLCSDGLTRAVTDEEIRRAVLESAGLDVACRRLIEMANQRGGEDNVTVVLAGVGGDLPASTPSERLSATYEVLESFGEPRGKTDAPIVPAHVKFTP
jgi:serine/threonine protein phosphatase PrpC